MAQGAAAYPHGVDDISKMNGWRRASSQSTACGKSCNTPCFTDKKWTACAIHFCVFVTGLAAQTGSALRAAAGKDLFTVCGSHSLAEAVNLRALTLLGLICSLHAKCTSISQDFCEIGHRHVSAAARAMPSGACRCPSDFRRDQIGRNYTICTLSQNLLYRKPKHLVNHNFWASCAFFVHIWFALRMHVKKSYKCTFSCHFPLRLAHIRAIIDSE